MGSPPSEPGRSDDENFHEVVLTHPFLISRTVCTQAAYEAVVGPHPFKFTGPALPATGISWNAARAFCDRAGLDLPTEAQWEYACRAGTTTTWSFGDDAAVLGEYAWYAANSGSNLVKPVAGRMPNAFGLYDMHGGVWQWCADWYAALPSRPEADPTGPAQPTSRRVVRGGGWNSAIGTRSATRDGGSPAQVNEAGFRPAKVID